MITLKDFIKETLSEIADGVTAFEKAHEQSDVTAKPKMKTKGDLAGNAAGTAGLLYLGSRTGYATLVNFDVAITAEENEASKAGGGIRVYFAKAEGGVESTSSSSSVNRVQFTIPLKLVS